MRRILIDVNVILDVLVDREPHSQASAKVWALVESGRAKAFLSAHAVTTLHYLIRKQFASSQQADKAIESLLRIFRVAAVDAGVINRALMLPATDFEDAVTMAAAEAAGCELIITRDPKGFRSSPTQALTPESFAHLYESGV